MFDLHPFTPRPPPPPTTPRLPKRGTRRRRRSRPSWRSSTRRRPRQRPAPRPPRGPRPFQRERGGGGSPPRSERPMGDRPTAGSEHKRTSLERDARRTSPLSWIAAEFKSSVLRSSYVKYGPPEPEVGPRFFDELLFFLRVDMPKSDRRPQQLAANLKLNTYNTKWQIPARHQEPGN